MPSDLVGKKIAVSVMFDTVSIEIMCGDGYDAQVLYEDITDRLRDGETISLTFPPLKAKTESKR
jgi:hypothetical protein